MRKKTKAIAGTGAKSDIVDKGHGVGTTAQSKEGFLEHQS